MKTKKEKKVVGSGKNFHRISKEEIKDKNREKSFFEILVADLLKIFNSKSFQVIKKRTEGKDLYLIKIKYISFGEMSAIKEKYNFGIFSADKKEIIFHIQKQN